jgi:hypothetical protein
VNFVLLSGQGKKDCRLWQFALVTWSPTPPIRQCVPVEEKDEEEEGAIYFLLFISVISFVVDFNQISAFYSWYSNKLLIPVGMLPQV